MEAVAADAVLGSQFAGQRILARLPRHRTVKRRVEHGHVRHARTVLERCVYACEIRVGVQWRQQRKLLDALDDPLVEQRWAR